MPRFMLNRLTPVEFRNGKCVGRKIERFYSRTIVRTRTHTIVSASTNTLPTPPPPPSVALRLLRLRQIYGKGNRSSLRIVQIQVHCSMLKLSVPDVRRNLDARPERCTQWLVQIRIPVRGGRAAGQIVRAGQVPRVGRVPIPGIHPVPSECDDAIRRAAVSKSRGLPHRGVTDGLRRLPF